MTKTISNPTRDIPQVSKSEPLKKKVQQDSANADKPLKPAKKTWWKFWQKNPNAAKAESLKKTNLAESKPARTEIEEKQDVKDFSALTGRGRSNNLAPVSQVTPVVAQREIEDPMIRAFNELKASNTKLNSTLTEIAQHLKSSAARDEKVVSALQLVDQSVALTSSAIATSAEKTDQSLGRLNDHIVYSTNAFSGMVERIETNDTQNRKMMTSLQKRSNLVMIGLGVTIVATAITLSVLHLVMG